MADVVRQLKIRRRPIAAVRAYKQRVSDDLTIVEWADGSSAGELTLTEADAIKLCGDLSDAVDARNRWRAEHAKSPKVPLPGSGGEPHDDDQHLPLHDDDRAAVLAAVLVARGWVNDLEAAGVATDLLAAVDAVPAPIDVPVVPLAPLGGIVDEVAHIAGLDPLSDRIGGGSEPS